MDQSPLVRHWSTIQGPQPWIVDQPQFRALSPEL